MTTIEKLEDIAVELDEIAVGLSCLAEQNEGIPGGAILDSYSRYVDRIGRDVGRLALDLTRSGVDAAPDPGEGEADPKPETTSERVILR